MSRTKIQNAKKVLVRAFGDEPVVLVAISETSRTIKVARPGEATAISLPRDLVFPFEEVWFKRLSAAFNRGDREELNRLWRSVAA